MDIVDKSPNYRIISRSFAMLSISTILLALTTAAFAQSASHNGKSASETHILKETALRGEQPAFLSSPPERISIYTSDSQLRAVSAQYLALTHLSEGNNKRIYPKIDKVRKSMASNRPLQALLQSPQVGDRLRKALQNTILFIGVPGYGEDGYNDFNALSLPGNRKNGNINGKFLNIFNRPEITANRSRQNSVQLTPSPDESKTATKPNLNLGFLSDIQPQKSPDPAAVPRRGGMGGRAAPLRDFSALISMSSNNQQATLYVFGSIPATSDMNMPFNFTVEAKCYAPAQGAVTVDYNTPPEINTLLDKQYLGRGTNLSPESAGYFCYIYPLTIPDTGGQFDILISYWMNESLALTHGIAVAKRSSTSHIDISSASDLITIPMTRIQYFQKDYRYSLLQSTVIGDRINLFNFRRNK